MRDLSIYREMSKVRYDRSSHNYVFNRILKNTGMKDWQLTELVHDYDRFLDRALNASFEIVERGTEYDDDGNVRSTTFMLVTELEELEAQLLVDHMYPPTYCQHSYDCCGQWYQWGYPKLEKTHYGYKVTVGEYQNV